MSLDVTHFHPDEINVRTADNRVIVEGKHEEREDDCGVVQRYFKRTYTLPRVRTNVAFTVPSYAQDGCYFSIC